MATTDPLPPLPDSLQWLAKYQGSGVTWQAQEVPLGNIMLDQAKQYQARIERFYPDVVSRYASAMKSGATFPRIVVVTAGARTFEIIDGLHRTLAAQEIDRKNIPAFVLSSLDHETRVSMVAECNSAHGLPYSTQERLLHGLMLVDNGYTHMRAAEVVGLTQTRISDAVHHRNADIRAHRLGLDGWDKLRPTTRRVLHRLHDDTVFVNAVEFASKAALTSPELQEMVTTANQRRTAAGGLQVIQEFRERLGMRASVKSSDGRKMPIRTKFMAGLGHIERQIDSVDLSPTDLIRVTEIAERMLAKVASYKENR